MALPCSTTITSSELASLFLTRFVTFFGLPKEIFSDVDKSGHLGLSEAFWKIYTRPLQASRS